MVENLLNDTGVFDAGNDLHRSAAVATGFDVDVEDSLQALRPRQGDVAWRWVLFVRRPGFLTFAALGRHDPRAVFTVRSEHAVESCQVYPGLRHQGRQRKGESF